MSAQSYTTGQQAPCQHEFCQRAPRRRGGGRSWLRIWTLIIAAAAAAVGLTVCAAVAVGVTYWAASGGTPAAAPATTVTQTAPASPAPEAKDSPSAPASPAPAAAPAAPASGSGGSPSAAKLPDYQPSTVVSKSEYSTVLESPDPVSNVGQFYRNALAAGGWQVTSSSMSAYHASFTASRGHEGASVSVYSSGSGSGISISTNSRWPTAARGARP